ncbi:hypothetical protein TCAL_06810 [Tigriopus californicus]|uniref:Phosphatidylinositol 3,4,5-trisphosphate 3-phosphatase and dual-specificity protein phosphatase PTEN n=1 Tax=Tigriopus californicus TaxID=6832 RepID=A0A553PLA4_TIGCA|nr:phosphatidylinositol 3,4,5-trisphosphate 3-phosphatase and dual-specificity protein phosphatase PTEN-like [Tigriopus californicus]TRY78470.1 hypothetical protein TCAL_06810 [Tigriopus californicus]|eukprot:TCALIF_06810-PA protein Name:"Similar to PTEN Phosphatidylinositol 3,4,5-trisphosphate 3-phosphatase and dual-specificity protein phosphatase PTEN (Homo sapiens)" AED:0.03 eAED:0.03 QI:0/-1/0/1/-1/1/1/0/396
MTDWIKSWVSQNRIRYRQDGFNLDLSYITKRIIAMGFPAKGFESLYRNAMSDVKRFLELRHGDHYMVFNLCSENGYRGEHFQNRVAQYPFDDHHPPNFQMIKPFCEHVQVWLNEHPDNVAVIHCKAGKGRTGTMICAFLLHSDLFQDTEKVLRYHAEQRTKNMKGVTIPSQRRYISYYSLLLRENLQYKAVKLVIRRISIRPTLKMAFGNECSIGITVRQPNRKLNRSQVSNVDLSQVRDEMIVLDLSQPLAICGDIKVEFVVVPKLPGLALQKLAMPFKRDFHFWFNTYFAGKSFPSNLCHSVDIRRPSEELTPPGAFRPRIPNGKSEATMTLRLDKSQIDQAAGDRECRYFPNNFAIVLDLEKPADQTDLGAYSSSPYCPIQQFKRRNRRPKTS